MNEGTEICDAIPYRFVWLWSQFPCSFNRYSIEALLHLHHLASCPPARAAAHLSWTSKGEGSVVSVAPVSRFSAVVSKRSGEVALLAILAVTLRWTFCGNARPIHLRGGDDCLVVLPGAKSS